MTPIPGTGGGGRRNGGGTEGGVGADNALSLSRINRLRRGEGEELLSGSSAAVAINQNHSTATILNA